MALGRKPIEIVNDGKHQLLAKAEHWDRIYLQEVAKVQNGFAFSSDYFTKSEGMPLIRIRDIDRTTTVDKYSGKYNEDFIVRKGDILIGMDGDFKVAKWKGENALLNQRVCRIIPKAEKYNEKFLLFCLQPFLDAIHAETSSVTVKHISSKTIEEIPLPLPPFKEQNEIVSKIEELFSELDKGIENLHTAQQQLKTYRQSVLKWAFEGKLTNENVTEGELPEGWKIQKLNDIGTWKGGGTPSKANKAFWEKGKILWVSPKDMKSKTIHDTIDKITTDAIANSSTKLIDKGSILFVVRSGILRRTLPVAITICDVTVNQDLQAFTPKDVLPDYVYWYVQAKNEDIRRDCSKDGTTVESIESSLLKNYLIPVCSDQEQHNIVQAIESRLSVADKMEESITQSLQQAEALRQSILKKAFEGRLL